MEFRKVFDQAVRDIKREINLKIFNVPEIEQKVLDATSDEPWGPHGSDLSEIARATKHYNECRIIMYALWTRLNETDSNWRQIYKTLVVIEYLLANGSEEAVDDIIEHGSQIASTLGFEFVEDNGKDMGGNVRNKAEKLMDLVSDRDKIKQVRDKASANRDKYFGLSSSGISYQKSPITREIKRSHYCGNNWENTTREKEKFKDSYDADRNQGFHVSKSRQSHAKITVGNMSKKSIVDQERKLQHALSTSKIEKLVVEIDDDDDDFNPRGCSADDDFDPRGTSIVRDPVVAQNTNKLDLLDDSCSDQKPNLVPPEVDFFADMTFISTPPSTTAKSVVKNDTDLFAPKADPFPVTLDLFDKELEKIEAKPTITETRKEQEIFGHTSSESSIILPNSNNTENLKWDGHTEDKELLPKKENFQVKSKIWADTLNRGIIDLNIASPKKTSLVEIGITSGIGDAPKENQKSSYSPIRPAMGRAMRERSKSNAGADGFAQFSQQSFGSFKQP